MEQKKKDKDVLIVRDEKTGEISVVAGLDKDGNPNALPPRRRMHRTSFSSTDTAMCWTTSSRTSSGSARNPAVSVFTVWRQTRRNTLSA